jgi:hypothetical protein
VTTDAPFLLQPEERDWIEKARDWVKGHFSEDAEEKYAPISGKLRVISAVLDNGWVAPSETWKLQSLGIAFGDAMAQKLMLEWVTIDDEYGRVPALKWPGTSLFSFPLTAISKRVEGGEAVDVHQLFESFCADLSAMAFSGQYV